MSRSVSSRGSTNAARACYDMPGMRVIVYQLFVRHFSNFKTGGQPWGSRDEIGCGTFAGITDAALESLARLGVTHLWLTGVLRHATQTAHPGLPAHPACVVKGIAGSPYAVTDYFDVDPDLARDPARRLDEFRALLARCRRWGMVPMIDFVPNHVSRCYKSTIAPQHEFGAHDRTDVFFDRHNSYFYLEQGSGEGRMQLPDGEYEPERGCGRVTGNNAATWTPTAYDWYETVKLNYGCDYRHGSYEADALPGIMAPREAVPRTWRLLDEALAWWQSMGVGGFRCDMAHMVPLPFWRWAIAHARMRDGATFFMAEAYNDHMKLIEGDVHHALLTAGFNGVYDAGAYQALRAMYENNAWANDLDTCHRTGELLFHGGVRYVENHDEPRLASPRYWAGQGEQVARALMVAQYATTCAPVLFYNGQEAGERAEGPGGYGGDNGRTSIFDYTQLPRLQRWTNGGKYDGALMLPAEQELRDFCGRLLRLLQHPALAKGEFYGLNWANRQTEDYGREPGETTSGHRVYAFLRHDAQARSTVLVVCHFSPRVESPAQELIRIHIPRHAQEWARKLSATSTFADLLEPDTTPLTATAQQLETTGLALRVPAGSARILEWR